MREVCPFRTFKRVVVMVWHWKTQFTQEILIQFVFPIMWLKWNKILKLGCWKHVLALQLCLFYLQLKDPGIQRKKSELSSAVMLMSVKKKVFKVYMYIQWMITPKCLFLLILRKWCLQFLKNLQLNSSSLFHLMKSKQKWSTRKLSINPSLNFGLIKGQEELQLPHFTLCATLERAQTEETLLNISWITVQLLKMPCHDSWHGGMKKKSEHLVFT